MWLITFRFDPTQIEQDEIWYSIEKQEIFILQHDYIGLSVVQSKCELDIEILHIRKF